MEKDKLYSLSKRILTVLFTIAVLCLMVQFYTVKVSDRDPVTVSSDIPDTSVSVETPEPTDSWNTAILQADGSHSYTGTTYSVNVVNGLNYAIKDWKLEIQIKQECYLNGFWCGKMEIHQFRDGEEITETVDSAQFDLDSMKLEHNTFSDELMIKLRPGDYMVYLPSEAVGETYVAGGDTIGIGMILYHTDRVDLTDNTITYYNQRNITDGWLFKVALVIFSVALSLTIVYAVSVLTYNSTKKEVEALSRSVIDGLSREYKSLWIIDTATRNMRLVRNLDDKEVQDAVEIAKGFSGYDESLRYYVDHYIDEKDRDRVWENIQFDALLEHLQEEKFFTVNYLQHSVDGKDMYYQLLYTRIIDDDGTDNIILAYRDVDRYTRDEQIKKEQLEEALAQAEQANKTKSEFLANMSHEIRTPINAILGMDTMILRESGEDSVKEYAREIKTASDTLLGLINDILDFSKIESGKMELVPVDYRLDSVINDLMNMIRPKAAEKDLGVELVLNPGTPAKLTGDEIRVKQIILNILNNAVKYTRQGKITWTVDYEKTGDKECALLISVKDTGIGIKPEDIDKMFSPYERLERNKNRTVEGTGLGLSIVKNLLEKMGSRLEVESVYGEGSTFKFRLLQPMWGPEPVGDHLSETAVDEETEEKFHAPSADILVVDDVEMNLMVIKGLLKRTQIRPVMCLSGAEGLELAKGSRYDVILLDAMMPGMSGEETLQHIREEASLNKETPVIVLTANAIVGAKEEYMAAGFTDYLSKPVNGQQLEDMLQKYLPEDKILLPGTEGFTDSVSQADGGSQQDGKSGENSVLRKLRELPVLSTEEGIKASGGEDTYVNVCLNFKETAESRIKMIRDFYDANDADDYAIQTHALKSSARLIGAMELSALAFEMEKAGKSGDWDLIRKHTEKLLDDYRTIYNELKNIFDTEQDTEAADKPRKELTPKKLKRILGDLQELIAAYDNESAKELLGSLNEYRLPEDFQPVYTSLKGYMAEVDYDSILRETERYLSEGGKQ